LLLLATGDSALESSGPETGFEEAWDWCCTSASGLLPSRLLADGNIHMTQPSAPFSTHTTSSIRVTNNIIAGQLLQYTVLACFRIGMSRTAFLRGNGNLCCQPAPSIMVA